MPRFFFISSITFEESLSSKSTITSNEISFNSWCSRCFDRISNIQLLLHPTERKMAIRPCGQRDVYNIPWRKNEDSPVVCVTVEDIKKDL